MTIYCRKRQGSSEKRLISTALGEMRLCKAQITGHAEEVTVMTHSKGGFEPCLGNGPDGSFPNVDFPVSPSLLNNDP